MKCVMPSTAEHAVALASASSRFPDRPSGWRGAVFRLYPRQRFFARLERAFELARFDCFEDFAELRAGFHSHIDQIIARDQWRGNDWLIGELFLFAQKKFVIVEHGMTARAI